MVSLRIIVKKMRRLSVGASSTFLSMYVLAINIKNPHNTLLVNIHL